MKRLHSSTRFKKGINLFGPFLILSILACIYFAFKLIPLYYANFEFQRMMRDQARDFQVGGNEDSIRRRIVSQAKSQFEIIIDPKDVYFESKDSKLFVDVYYSRVVPLIYGSIRLKFEPAVVVKGDKGGRFVP